MPYQVIITGQTGGTPPYTFYICDENGNNCQNIGSSGGTFTLSPLFQTAEVLMVKVVDSTGCETFQLVSCVYLLQEDGFFLLQENGYKILIT